MTDEPSGTLRSMLAEAAHRHPERPALSYRLPAQAPRRGRARRDWRTLTWHELARLVVDVADALELAIGSAHTIAILADTDARYPILELAAGISGRAVQPLYVSSDDGELRGALATTGAVVLVVGRSQLARAHAAALHPAIVELDRLVRLPGVGREPGAVLPPDVEPFDTGAVRARLAALPARAPNSPLLYLQSTGTTGPARVIEIGERALCGAVRAVQTESSHPFPRLLSFLPTAHISERFLTLYVSLALAGHTYYGGGLVTLAEDLRACRPTILLAPPLLLESLRAQAIAEGRSTGLGRRLLASVERTADAIVASGVAGGARRSLGARLFGRQLRRQAGLDQVRDAIAGTAPLSPSLQAWFEAVGIPLRVVYGQTELPGATSMTSRRRATLGAVGVPVAGVALRISDDGELLVRSPSVFNRYLGDADATARTRGGGWLRTGDRARLLPTGELHLIGRVQSRVTASDGVVVDTADLAARVRALFGDADVVFPTDAPATGVYLYAALRPAVTEPVEAPQLRQISNSDVRWEQLAKLIEQADPHRVVRGWALYEGAFSQSTGEVGPTGKPRGWRIHELRSDRLRFRGAAAASTPDARSAAAKPGERPSPFIG